MSSEESIKHYLSLLAFDLQTSYSYFIPRSTLSVSSCSSGCSYRRRSRAWSTHATRGSRSRPSSPRRASTCACRPWWDPSGRGCSAKSCCRTPERSCGKWSATARERSKLHLKRGHNIRLDGEKTDVTYQYLCICVHDHYSSNHSKLCRASAGWKWRDQNQDSSPHSLFVLLWSWTTVEDMWWWLRTGKGGK